MLNKKITLAEIGNLVQGIYEARVIESPALPRLRRKAFEIAGLFGDYDGSVSAYHGLDEYAKLAHDKVLSKLVARNRKMLMSTRRQAKVISTTGKQHNLILDQGLNKMLRSSGTISWSTWSTNCVAGTGTTATETDSAAITATTSGSSTTVTASSTIFTSAHVGQLLRFNSGEERYIASQTGTACVVTAAVNIAAPTLFTIWATNQTGLASESKRTTTYLTGTGNCGSSWASNVWSALRTHDFTAEVSNVNYTELGWSDTAATGANLNSRTLISGGTVSVLIGQQLRVIYTLNVTVTPNSSTAGTYGITGWPISPSAAQLGNYIIANPSASIGPTINTSGGSTGDGLFPMCRKSTANHNLGTGTTLPTFGNSYSAGTSVSSGSDTFLSYTDNTFFVDLQGVFVLAVANRTDWRGVYIGPNTGYVFVWAENQTKASTFTLTIRTRMSVGRTLVNP